MSFAGFGKVLSLVLKFAHIAEEVHGSGDGATKKDMVVALSKFVAPTVLKKAGHDLADADALVDHALGAFEQALATAKLLKK